MWLHARTKLKEAQFRAQRLSSQFERNTQMVLSKQLGSLGTG